MIPAGLLARAQAALDGLNGSTAFLRTVTTTKGASGRDVEANADGALFSVNLQPLSGDEVPQGLALMNRTIYEAYVPVDCGATAQHRLVVDGVVHEIHDVPDGRTNAFSLKITVSRLK